MNPTIRKILENINTLSKELEKADEKSNETNVSDATVHKEILRSFRGQNSQPTASTSNANTVSGGGTSSSTVPKFQLAYNFMKGRKRKQVKTSTKKASGTYVKDVILLAGPNEDKVPRQGVRIFLSENNHIVSGATFSKDLDYLPLCDYLKSLFPSKLGEFDDIEILMPVHSKLLPPNLAPGQQLSAFLLQKIFKDRPIYIRPSKTFLDIPGLQLSKKRKTETEVYELTDDDGEDEDDDLIFKTSVFEKQENEIKELSTVDPEKCDEPSGSKVTAEKADSNESSVVHEVTSLPTTSNSALSATKPGTPVPNTSSVVEAAIPTQSPTTVDSEFQSVITLCIQYIYEKGITDPVEVLRCAQSSFNVGRDLDIQRASESLEGETNFINIDRYNVLDSALEEVQELENPRLTLEVSFYGESAQDSGGPRREFFRLCLQEIKTKYFDNGLKEHLSKDYENVGLLMALSVLQNGSIPRFLSEELLQELFNASKPSKCIENLRKGFARVGLYQIGSVIPIFLQLFRPSPAAVLTRKKSLHVLSPKFSEEGSNARKDESSVYAAFNKYCREAASGRRGNVTLNHVLQFVTGADEEPLLGFGASPAIEFPEASGDKAWNFVPFANTCANTLHLRRPTLEYHLPSEEVLFEMFDYAFVNAYFGKV